MFEQKAPIDKIYKFDCPFPMALLADFHEADPVPIIDSLSKSKPEIILIAGDLIQGSQPIRNELRINESPGVLQLLRACTEIAPTFVSLGNHEFMFRDEDLQVIASTGVILLDNTWTSYKDVFIGGLSSAYCNAYREFRNKKKEKERYPAPSYSFFGKKHVPRLSWLREFEKCDGYKILLCHHPEYYPLYLKNRNIDLICSGHCHGGQWRYNSLYYGESRGVYAPGQGFFPPLTSGIHDNKLIISQGLSNPTSVPRINNPTEIVYIVPSCLS